MKLDILEDVKFTGHSGDNLCQLAFVIKLCVCV